MGVACVWLGIASKKTYTIFILGRAFLGIFEAPIESIVPSTVTDTFFLHDRGEKVSIYGLSVLGGNELGPMFSAFIIQSLGINWAFYIVSMFIGLNLVTKFFFMPETKFTGYRPTIVPGDHSPTSGKDSASSHVEKLGEKDVLAAHEEVQPSIPKHSRIRSLTPWGKNDPNVSLLRAFPTTIHLNGIPNSHLVLRHLRPSPELERRSRINRSTAFRTPVRPLSALFPIFRPPLPSN
jgi:MFS family permease